MLLGRGNDQAPLPQLERQFDGFGQAGSTFAGHQTIDDNLDVVPHLAVEFQIVGQSNNVAIDARAGEALFEQVDEQFARAGSR